MFLIDDVDRLESFFAQGQQVKSIYECRALALRYLPNHEARIADFLAIRGSFNLPQDRYMVELCGVYGGIEPENRQAADVVYCCAKWLENDTSPRQTRNDIAASVFIGLRELAINTEPAAPVELADDAPVPMADAPEQSLPPAPLQRRQAQDAAVLAQIKALNLDPQRLPKYQPGKRGVKADVRDSLKTNKLFSGGTTFNKCWERMTQFGDIEYLG